MIRGILFDKDGTLVDFNATWLGPYQRACRYVAEIAGAPGTESVLMERGGYQPDNGTWSADSLLSSDSNDQILAFFEREAGCRLSASQVLRLRQFFSYDRIRAVPAVENLNKLMESFRTRGMILGVATMDDEANARGMLEQSGILSCFDFVCGADSGYGVKPDPGMVLAFCRECGLTASEICMVGDSPRDLMMGKNAGAALSVGVLTGAHGREELCGYADRVMEDIRGLESLID